MQECDAQARRKYAEYEKQGTAKAWACWRRAEDGSVPLAYSNRGEEL